MNTTLTKELIEAQLTSKYIGAKEFVWNNASLSFEYDKEVPADATIKFLTMENDYLKRQTNTLIGRAESLEWTVKEFINGREFYTEDIAPINPQEGDIRGTDNQFPKR